jgi:Transposase and inactivated derivatives
MTTTRRITYSETFKLEVLRDYYSSGMSKNMIAKKWGLSSHSLLIKWLKRYPIAQESLSLGSEIQHNCDMLPGEDDKKELLSDEILRLKKALEIEKLRSRAFEKLIEITEKEEGISILKKDGAKQ